jgi:CDP-glucose 4,6-dehydratase
MDSRECDILDASAVLAAVSEARPEVVMHLAAQPIVRASFEDPIGTYATNIMGTAHVLDAVRLAGGVRVVINVTTDKVYENREWEWGYREDEALGGHDPYASSKACSEVITIAYRRSFFGDGETRLATARAGNVIGGGDWARDRLIPDLLRGAVSGDPVRIRNPNAIRPWQHVLNPLDGYLTLVERLWEDPDHGHGWNFGPESIDDKPVGWIADRMTSLLGDDLSWEHDAGEHTHEATYLRLDSSLAWARLGWAARWDLDQALSSIVDFFGAEQSGADLRETVLSQIEAFEGSEASPRGAQAWS